MKILLHLILISVCLFPAQNQTDPLCLIPLAPNCTSCVNENLDLSTDCTTCRSMAGPIECTPEGNSDCGVGNFTFSALFHSYSNPTAMCGECGPDDGPVTCASLPGEFQNCPFRFIYCLQPYGAPVISETFPVQQAPIPIPDANTVHTFEEGFIVQSGGSGSNRNFWNKPNPFTREFQTWPGQVQLYIEVYHFNVGDYLVVDRVPIDLALGISSDFTERRTYSGIHSISQFDMSFSLSGQCAEGYTGPWCNVLCSELEAPADDTQDNCQLGDSTNIGPVSATTPAHPATSTGDTGDPVPTSSLTALIGGVLGGVLGVALLVILSLLLLMMLLFLKRNRSKHGVQEINSSRQLTESDIKMAVHSNEASNMEINQIHGVRSTGDNTVEANVVYSGIAGEKMEMTQNQLYGVRSTNGDNIVMEANVSGTAGEKMEMTQNQLYGVRSTGDNITMEANVGYGVTNDGPGHTPPPTVEDAYDYV